MTEVWPPRTRLSAALLALGCRKEVDWPVAMEKVCQLMMARLLACVIVTALVPCPATEAEPAATFAPDGFAQSPLGNKLKTTATANLNAILFIILS